MLHAHNRARPPRSSIHGVAQAIGAHGARHTIAGKFLIFDVVLLPLTPPFVRTSMLHARNRARPPRSSIRGVAKAIGAHSSQRAISGKPSIFDIVFLPLTHPFVRTSTLHSCRFTKSIELRFNRIAEAISASSVSHAICSKPPISAFPLL